MTNEAVLRCGRCGLFVGWPDSRLQIVCTCRPHLESLPVLVREATADDRVKARQIFMRHFGHTPVVAFGEVLSLETAAMLVAEAEGDVGAALAWRLLDTALHVMAVATDPMWQRAGLAGHLLAEAELLARREQRERVIATIANDNIPALYFYQRRGYRVTGVVADSFGRERAVPGFGGIPLRDEIHLAKTVT
jgi:ribosomal protein S18 acetylase RimI-like enzyme